jgi:hypothetical protein
MEQTSYAHTERIELSTTYSELRLLTLHPIFFYFKII